MDIAEVSVGTCCQKLYTDRGIRSQVPGIEFSVNGSATPYQRVLESPEISAEIKQSLKEHYKTLNPFDFRNSMEEKLKRIFKH